MNAEAGDEMNWSASELAAFQELRGAPPRVVQDQLRRVLLARYRSYRAAGLGGIAPYDRGCGGVADVASDLLKATNGAVTMHRFLPALQTVLIDYPQAALPGLQQHFLWLKSIIRGKATYVLAHILTAGSGGGASAAGSWRVR